MKKYSLYLLAALFLTFFYGPASSFAQKAERFFNPKDLMLVGSYYYPEQWPERDWERDIKKMAELGFDFTHMGEFAWSTMEPREGEFNFTWLDKAIAYAKKYKIRVVLCTPSPTPPVWLTEAHPDVLMVNAEGRTIQHGARQQASWSSETYRRYVAKIVELLARRYGQQDVVIGWQVDNEPSHYGSAYDYSANAQKKFRHWLRDKYKHIDTLNTVWGNAFWSQHYNNFEQIRIPNPKELVQQANPHAILDFKRFTADEAADFVIFQQNVLRKYIADKQWVTTNLMPSYTPVDPFRFKTLDFLTYTKYVVYGEDKGHGDQGFRMGSSNNIGLSNDFFRPITGVSGVMELQPGQVNWGAVNPQTMPGAVRMWIYHVLAGGNKFVCNYRFRQPLSGGEQYHYGIMNTDGVTVSRTGEEYVRVIKELKQLRTALTGRDTPVSAPAKIAMLYHPDNRWEMDYQPQTNRWDFFRHFSKYYTALKSLGQRVDVIDESHDFAVYPVLVAPAYQLLDKQLVKRWEKYVRDGGHLVLTCRTGQKDRNAHLWEGLFAAPIHQLAGIKSIYFDMLPGISLGKIAMDNKQYTWGTWADIMETDSAAETWAVYNDQFYKGKAAIVHRPLGRGSVTYVGIDGDTNEAEYAVLKKVFQQAHLRFNELPDGLVFEQTDKFKIVLNYSSQDQPVQVPPAGKLLIGQRLLKPSEVAIWQE